MSNDSEKDIEREIAELDLDTHGEEEDKKPEYKDKEKHDKSEIEKYWD